MMMVMIMIMMNTTVITRLPAFVTLHSIWKYLFFSYVHLLLVSLVFIIHRFDNKENEASETRLRLHRQHVSNARGPERRTVHAEVSEHTRLPVVQLQTHRKSSWRPSWKMRYNRSISGVNRVERGK